MKTILELVYFMIWALLEQHKNPAVFDEVEL